MKVMVEVNAARWKDVLSVMILNGFVPDKPDAEPLRYCTSTVLLEGILPESQREVVESIPDVVAVWENVQFEPFL